MKFAGFRYHGRKAAMKKVSQRYTEFLQVYFIAGDLDAVGPDAVGLFVGTAEGKGTGEFPFGIDHAVAGDMVGIRVLVQGIAHGPGHLRFSGHGGNLTVGGDAAFRNLFDGFIDPLRRTVGDEIIAFCDHAPDVLIGDRTI